MSFKENKYFDGGIGSETRKKRMEETGNEAEKKEPRSVIKHEKEIKEMINNNSEVVIISETGSGKTTKLPIFLREIVGPEGKIAVTQPRQVAARSVCKYVAREEGCGVGEEIGYQVRFDDHTSEGTSVNFMTDGILLRKIQSDPLLEEYDAVMVDEAHERNKNIDFVLGLLKRIQKKRREIGIEPLKIVVSSATLEKEKFTKYFGESSAMEIPGRSFEIETNFLSEEEYKKYLNHDKKKGMWFDYVSAAKDKLFYRLANNRDGHDYLIFMPGEEEIYKTIEAINNGFEESGLKKEDFVCLPIYGRLDPEEQDKIFRPTKERKIIIATNIAETSLTPNKPVNVIDSALIKMTNFNSSTGIGSLDLIRHAKSGLKQREGRAGRLDNGVCDHLITAEMFKNLPDFQMPEIQRSNLAQVVLTMKKIGIDDVESFEFIDPPSKESIQHALETLIELGALDKNEKITSIGEIMAELPLEPYISRMIIEAEKYGCVEEVVTIAALMGEKRSFFARPRGKETEADTAHEKFKGNESDFISLLKVYKDFIDCHFDERWARENFINIGALFNARNVRGQIFRTLKHSGIRTKYKQDFDFSENVEKSIAAGLIGNLLKRGYRYSYVSVAGKKKTDVFIFPASECFGEAPEFMVAGKIEANPKGKKYAKFCQRIKPEWLKEIAPQLLEERAGSVFYDSENDKVMQKIELSLKGYGDVISKENREALKEEAAKEFARALLRGSLGVQFVKRNEEILEEAKNIWLRAEGMGAKEKFDFEQLLDFYMKRLGGVSSKKELERMLAENKINLELNLDDFVSPENKRKILEENPDNLEIEGKIYQIKYENGHENNFTAKTRILAQDVFSLKETPKLPSGRILKLGIIMKEGDENKKFESSDFVELRKKAKEYLLDKQWSDWKYSDKSPKERQLENFDLLGEMPNVPEPAQYGVDPETKAPVLAYASVEKDYYSDKFFIRYFSNLQKAQEALEKVVAIMAEAKNKKNKEDEKERLLAPAKKKLSELQTFFEEIKKDYSNYGIDYDKKDEIKDKLYSAGNIMESDTKKAMEILEEADVEIKQALEYKEKADLSHRKADEAIVQYYSACPLCGKKLNMLERLECVNLEHDADLIDFDENDNPAILSQIVNDRNEIIAQLCCSAGTRKYYRGNIYLLAGTDWDCDERWKGESFESLKFKDLGKILTKEQAEERKLEREELARKLEMEEKKREYEEALKYAEDQVEKGIWRKGKFSIGTHPKTGQLQYELEIKKGGKTVKYIANQFGILSEAGKEYYFSDGKALINASKFELIIANIKPPYPEENELFAADLDLSRKGENLQSKIVENGETKGLEKIDENIFLMKGFFGSWTGQEGLRMYAVKGEDGLWEAYVGEPKNLIKLKGFKSTKKTKTPEELIDIYKDPYGGYFKGDNNVKQAERQEPKKEEPPEKKKDKDKEEPKKSAAEDLIAQMNKNWK